MAGMLISQAKSALNGREKEIEIGVYAQIALRQLKLQHAANQTVQAMREFSAQDYLEFAQQWYGLGATVIGDCCWYYPNPYSCYRIETRRLKNLNYG
ncbi:hypothetical protein ACT691_18060 [Vibrio metschnikovii]